MKKVLAVLGVLSLAFLGLGYTRSENGLIHAFDTGLYLQLLNNLLQGRGFMSSIVQEPQFLAHHFQPILVLLLPFHALSSSAWMLLVIGWLCALFSAGYMLRELPRRQLASEGAASLAALTLFLHPTLSSRIYYSFVPEVLALPFLTVLACALVSNAGSSRRAYGFLFPALLAIGLCKENYWLTSAWLAGLLAMQSRDRAMRCVWGLTSAVFVIVMLFIFLKWMPEHSTLATYYGLSYFHHEEIDPASGMPGVILGAALNMMSATSLGTAATLLLLIPCGLTLVGNKWTTLAIVPTLALVMAASNDQIHDLTNHYLLAALPFLALSLATGWDRLRERLPGAKLRFYAALALILIPAGFTFMHHSGWLFQLLFAQERLAWELRPASMALKPSLNPDELILVDGQLQPFFHDFPRVRVIQAFQGNPRPLTPEDLAQAAHVITANDLSALSDCDAVQTEAGQLVRYDLGNFRQYCRWLKSQSVVRKEYLPGRLIHLKIQR